MFMKKVFYVCNEHRGNPVVAHETYEDAVKEAKRLAEKERCKFKIFIPVAVVVPEVTVRTIEFNYEEKKGN